MKAKDLEGLGLSAKEAKVYLSLLEIGNDTALAVSQRAKLPKSTTHDVLRRLTARGLVSHYRKKNKKVFAAGDPSLIGARIHSQKKAFEELLPELQTFYGEKKNKPRVRFYESKQGIETATSEMIEETREMVFISSWVSTYETYPEYFPRAARERVKHGVFARALVTQEEGVEDIRAKDREMLRESRLLPKGISFGADVWIWKGKVVFYNTKEDASVVILEDVHIADMLLQVFELLWKQAGEKSGNV